MNLFFSLFFFTLFYGLRLLPLSPLSSLSLISITLASLVVGYWWTPEGEGAVARLGCQVKARLD
jgi:hypothetical protein